MVGANPEVNKRKALVSALNPTYVTTCTDTPEMSFSYSIVTKPDAKEEQKGSE